MKQIHCSPRPKAPHLKRLRPLSQELPSTKFLKSLSKRCGKMDIPLLEICAVMG
ncbi:UNVERIFIED_CONTAM: hypothetical protein GTU68_019044 [Idotea baltica]|nr:hypothetical protein [Idotea baltica]